MRVGLPDPCLDETMAGGQVLGSGAVLVVLASFLRLWHMA